MLHLNCFIDTFHDAFPELRFFKPRLDYPLDLFWVKLSYSLAKHGIRYLPQPKLE